MRPGVVADDVPVVAWTVDIDDRAEPGTRSIVRAVRAGAAPGVVVLSHDAGGNRSQSVVALRIYLPELLDSGYRITVPRRRGAEAGFRPPGQRTSTMRAKTTTFPS